MCSVQYGVAISVISTDQMGAREDKCRHQGKRRVSVSIGSKGVASRMMVVMVLLIMTMVMMITMMMALMELLPCARHCAMHVTCVNTFHLQAFV